MKLNSKINLKHLLTHISEVKFLIWFTLSLIWSKLFTSVICFLAHVETKSTKQLGAVNHKFYHGMMLKFQNKKSLQVFCFQ